MLEADVGGIAVKFETSCQYRNFSRWHWQQLSGSKSYLRSNGVSLREKIYIFTFIDDCLTFTAGSNKWMWMHFNRCDTNVKDKPR